MTAAAPPSPLATPHPWNLVSAEYAREIVPEFEQYAAEALRLAAPAKGAPIVDVACGPGTLAVLAARAGHPVDALDFSPKMIDLLDARKAQLGLEQLTTHVGDGTALPFAAGRFAAGFSMFGLMFFPDRARGFAELRRVLQPGARAVVSSWHPLAEVPAMQALFAALAESIPDLPRGPAMPLDSQLACRAEMAEAFTDVEVHAVTFSRTYDSIEALASSLERTMAPLVMMKQAMGDAWGAVAANLRAGFARALGDHAQTVAMPAWLTVGTAA